MKRFIGIDPGSSSGAIAMITEDGVIELYPLEKEILKQCCRDWAFDDCIVCLEKVGVMPGQGIVSMGSFMKSVGYICGVLEAFGLPYQEIPSPKWKREFGCNLGKGATTKEKKAKDVEVCRKLYPGISLRRTDRCKTDWYDAADAILLATYAKRKF